MGGGRGGKRKVEGGGGMGKVGERGGREEGKNERRGRGGARGSVDEDEGMSV